MKIINIGGKVIGIGDVTVLPGETEDVPAAYETSPVLEVYQRCGMAKIIGEAGEHSDTGENEADRAAKEREAAETLRQARLASLDGISGENLAKLAEELGVNFAACKDQADVLKKVKAALKK